MAYSAERRSADRARAAAHTAARCAGSAGPLRGGSPALPASVRRRCSPLRLRPPARYARPFLGRPGSHDPAIRRSMRRSLSAAERPSAGRGGTSARIRRSRGPPRLGSPPGPPLRGDPSKPIGTPRGRTHRSRTNWGGCRNPRTPGCPGNRAGHRQGPIVPGPSRTTAPRIPDSGRQRARSRRLALRGARAEAFGRAAAPSRGR
jgi:hypothetical protein